MVSGRLLWYNGSIYRDDTQPPGLGEVRCPQHAHNATGNETCIAGELRGVHKKSRDQLTPAKVHCKQQSHFEMYFVLWHRIVSAVEINISEEDTEGPPYTLSQNV